MHKQDSGKSRTLPSDPAWWAKRGRFLDKWYRKTPGCWEWTGTKNPQGYGVCTFVAAGKVTSSLAHRLQYQRHNGPISPSLVVMHSCNNPSCVNPDHLSVGTHADNNADCRQKGRADLSGLQNFERFGKAGALEMETVPAPEPPPVLSEWQKEEWRKRYG